MTTRTIPHNATNISGDIFCSTMMLTQLTMPVLMDRGPALAAEVEIVSKIGSHVHRYTYAELGRRARNCQRSQETWRSTTRPDRDALPGTAIGTSSTTMVPSHGSRPTRSIFAYRRNSWPASPTTQRTRSCSSTRTCCRLSRSWRRTSAIFAITYYEAIQETGRRLSDQLYDEQLLAQESSDFEWPDLDENSPMVSAI